MSTFYALDPGAVRNALVNLYSAMQPYFPQAGLLVKIAAEGDVIDSASGTLVSSWVGDDKAAIGGTGGGDYVGGTGSVFTWSSADVIDGHRQRGRTFMVPLVSSTFDVNGLIDTAALQAFNAAAATFVTASSGQLVIWHRPRAARAADGSRPAVTARAGSFSVVTGHRVLSTAAFLSSRRD